MINPFFENTGPHNINYLIKSINLNDQKFLDDEITDIKDLNSSKKGELTFFHSSKYIELAKLTKASYCLTKKENYPQKTNGIIKGHNQYTDKVDVIK